MYIAVTVIAAMLLGVGFVLQQHAASKLPTQYLHLRLIAELLHQRIFVAGVVIMVIGQGLSAWGLGHLSLTVSEPLLATNLIFALLLAAPISGEIPRRTELAGAVLLCAGVGVLSASRSVRALSESFGSFSHWPAAGIIAGVAAALVVAGRNGPASLRATLTGAGSGLLLGISDALTRRSVEIIDGHGLATLLTTWPGYAVIGTAAIGLWLVESAFAAGPLHASLPAITGAEPLAGMTLGVLVFGDIVHITPWLLALQAAGLAAMVGGVILVARAALQAAGLAAMVGGVILVARAPVFRKLHLRPTAAAEGTDSQAPGADDTEETADDNGKVTVPEASRLMLPKMTVPRVSVPKISVPTVTVPDLPVLSTPQAAIAAVARLRVPWLKITRLKIARPRTPGTPGVPPAPPAAR